MKALHSISFLCMLVACPHLNAGDADNTPTEAPPCWADSLILHYKLDTQRKDGLVPDESDHGNNGIEHVSSKVTEGVLGRAFQFSGRGEYIVRDFDPKSGLHPTNSPFAISAWFKTSSSSPREQTIVSTTYAGSSRDGYILTVDNRDNNGGKLHFTIGAGKRHELFSRQPCNDGRWHHAVAVWDRKAASLFLDGVLQGSIKTTGAIPYATRVPFLIGHSTSSGAPDARHQFYYFKGAMDEVKFYKRALSQAEVAALYRTVPQPAKTPRQEVIDYALALDKRFWQRMRPKTCTVGEELREGREAMLHFL